MSGSLPFFHSLSEYGGSITGLLTSSASSSVLVSSSLDGTCKVWNLVIGCLLQTHTFSGPVTAIVLDLAEQFLFCGTTDGRIFINALDIGLQDNPPILLEDQRTVLSGHNQSGVCSIKRSRQLWKMYKNTMVAFCIHIIAYQGRFAFSDFSVLNLLDQFRSSFDFIDGYNKPVKGRKINWMKAGILESVKVLTVSPYYADEVVSGEDRGVELDAFIRKTGIFGIVNGMDIQEWNPWTDKYISVNYDAATVMEAKALLKENLQIEFGLPVDRSVPLIGFIGRLEEQKGSDILVAAISQFIEEDVQIVVFGTGKTKMEKHIEALELHAMRYGTIPIVASTRGLVDTVKEGLTGFHVGSFNVDCEAVDPADTAVIASTVRRALSVYGTGAHREMVKNCMAQDLSWKGPAK
ncbi:hypothetical protein ACLOJK_038954 [Asimina triloba]